MGTADEQKIVNRLHKAKTFYIRSTKQTLVAIFDDGDNQLACYKEWLKHKKRWHYKIEEVWLMAFSFNSGHYKFKKG